LVPSIAIGACEMEFAVRDVQLLRAIGPAQRGTSGGLARTAKSAWRSRAGPTKRSEDAIISKSLDGVIQKGW